MFLRKKTSLQSVSLAEMGRLFLKLGAIGFGGPLAHIALIQDECVDKRNWIDRSKLLRGLSLCQMLPGPVSTQLAIYTGFRIAGFAGGLVAGAAFILPAFVLLLILTWAYFQFGTLMAVEGLFYGMMPVVLAMILSSTIRLAKPVYKDRVLLAVLVISGILIGFFHVSLIGIFAAAGLLGILLYGPWRSGASGSQLSSVASLPVLAQLAWYFLKVGSVIFGGGYVIIPFIEQEVVHRMAWLTKREFLDGLALGQMTPGPVVITATFIGYRVAGFAGAIVATAAIFLPSFVFIIAGSAYLEKIEDSPYVKAFLKTVNVAAIGAILGALWQLSEPVLSRPFTLVLCVAAFIAIHRYKVNFLIVLVVGALHGIAARWMRL
jgi:chromate transporter